MLMEGISDPSSGSSFLDIWSGGTLVLETNFLGHDDLLGRF